MVDEVAGERADVLGEFVDASVVEGGFAGNDAGRGGGEGFEGFGENHVADEAVVGAEKKEPVAAGAGDGLVHGVVDAGVGFGKEGGEAITVLLKPGEGAVGRGAVDDDDVGRDMALSPDAVERGGEARAGILADEDDAQRGRGGHAENAGRIAGAVRGVEAKGGAGGGASGGVAARAKSAESWRLTDGVRRGRCCGRWRR